jgi:hypothetical protein
MNRIISRTLTGAAALLLFAFAPHPAFSQTTYYACRVPGVNAIYMIKFSGGPTACLDASHVEFSWTEGGAVADGSITTAKLADAAVTGPKIATDAVTSSAILDGDVTSADIADGTITATDMATGAVGSDQIADGAVGTADLAGSAVTSAKIAAGAVGSAEVSDNSLTAADLAAGSVGASELGLEVVTVSATGITVETDSESAICPAGKRVISGGYFLTVVSGGTIADFTTTENAPSGGAQWTVVGRMPGATLWGWSVYAVCVTG